MNFHKAGAERLSPERARRQFETTGLAIALLGPQLAIKFMNQTCDALGARPIDLALSSTEGRLKVEAELQKIAANSQSDPKNMQ